MGAHRAAAGGPNGHERGREQDNRRFVEAVLWLARNGCRWLALPAKWGNWHTTYTRFQRWARSGVWAKVLAAVQQDEALHTLLLDSTTVRAHQHAAGAQKNGPQALGRSRGSLSSKLHAVADARGRPVRCRLSAGQHHDAPQALPLLSDLAPAYLTANCGYDSDPLVAVLAARGTCAVIPPRRKRRPPTKLTTVPASATRPISSPSPSPQTATAAASCRPMGKRGLPFTPATRRSTAA